MMADRGEFTASAPEDSMGDVERRAASRTATTSNTTSNKTSGGNKLTAYRWTVKHKQVPAGVPVPITSIGTTVPEPSEHDLQFLVKHARDMKIGVSNMNDTLRRNPPRRAAHYITILKRACAEFDVRNEHDTDAEKVAKLRELLPHAPSEIIEQMAAGIMYEKFTAPMGKADVRPDFTAVTLMILAMWAVGPGATGDQLVRKLLEWFPYFGLVSGTGDGSTYSFKEFASPEAAGWNVYTRLDWLVRDILQLNFRCHERLFIIMKTTDPHSRLMQWRLQLLSGQEGRFLEAYGITSISHSSHGLMNLPPEIRMEIFRHYFDLDDKILLPKQTDNDVHGQGPEPVVRYEDPQVSYFYKVGLPPLAKLLSPSLVCRALSREVPDALFKQLKFLPTGGRLWQNGVVKRYREFFRRGALRMLLRGKASTGQLTSLRLLGESTYSEIFDLMIDLDDMTDAAVLKAAAEFYLNPEVQCLTRFRNTNLAVSIVFPWRYVDGRWVRTAPTGADGKPLFEDNIKWLTDIMKQPKKLQDDKFVYPILPAKPKAASTLAKLPIKHLKHDIESYGGSLVDFESKTKLENAEWLAQKMYENYTDPGEVRPLSDSSKNRRNPKRKATFQTDDRVAKKVK